MKTDDFPPVLLVPGLNCSPRLYAGQIPSLWSLGPVMVADHRRDNTIAAIAKRILTAAPPRFRLAGLSMGGYIAFEIMRQAPERVSRLALLDTSAQPETPPQTDRRQKLIALARENRFAEINDILWPLLVHESRQADSALRAEIDEMARETGNEAFVRQQQAIISRPDSRPLLTAIQCPVLMIVGDSDRLTPPSHAKEIADNIPGARLAIVEKCGHLSAMERPSQVTKLLCDFLGSGA